MCVTAPPVEVDFGEILSSPERMNESMIEMFELPACGSIPSVLRAHFGVSILTPQAVNPFVASSVTWQLGELRSVMLYSVKSFERRTTSSRDTAWFESSTLARCASSHHVSF